MILCTDSVDLWSFGVILHELLFKEHPFMESGKGILTVIKTKDLRQVLEDEDEPLSDECIELLLGLLEPNPAKRTWATIQDNDWLNGNVEW